MSLECDGVRFPGAIRAEDVPTASNRAEHARGASLPAELRPEQKQP
jgi:hypothetical protein